MQVLITQAPVTTLDYYSRVLDSQTKTQFLKAQYEFGRIRADLSKAYGSFKRPPALSSEELSTYFKPFNLPYSTYEMAILSKPRNANTPFSFTHNPNTNKLLFVYNQDPDFIHLLCDDQNIAIPIQETAIEKYHEPIQIYQKRTQTLQLIYDQLMWTNRQIHDTFLHQQNHNSEPITIKQNTINSDPLMATKKTYPPIFRMDL